MFDPAVDFDINLHNYVNTELEKIEAATDITVLKIKEGFDEAGTAVTGVQKCFEDLNKVQGGLEEKAAQVAERFKAFSSSAKELAESVNGLNSALNVTPSAQTDEMDKTDASGGEEEGGPGLFWFFKKNTKEDKEKESEYEKAQREYFESSVEWANKLSEDKIKIAQKEFTALSGFDDLNKKAVLIRKNVTTSAYSAMETQLLRFIETNRFSVKEFGKTVAQKVKMELVGLAATSAVWAIFETAMGLKELAYFNIATAGLHFKSAAEFAAISGVALVGAAAVQKLAFGGPEKGASSSSGASAVASMTDSVPLNNNLSSQETTQTQQITLNIYNPLSEQNWQEIAENNIIPALKDASERNIELTVVTV